MLFFNKLGGDVPSLSEPLAKGQFLNVHIIGGPRNRIGLKVV